MRRLIFVHTPKCGGASVKLALVDAFGKHAVKDDYGDRIGNPESVFNLDPATFWQKARGARFDGIVFGHFHVAKYAHYPNALRATILRHPVGRLISNYFYFMSRPPKHSRLHEYVVSAKLSIADFARLPFVREIYKGRLFKDVDMAVFDLIMFQEQIDDGMAALSRLVRRPLVLPRFNTTTSYMQDYDERKRLILDDASLVSHLHEMLADDIAFFQECQRLPHAVGAMEDPSSVVPG